MLMQVTCLKLGIHRGGRRLWLQGLRLAAAGYLPGARYTVIADAVSRAITLRLCAGERVVSRKAAGSTVYPVIDLEGVDRVLGDFERAQVTITQHAIFIVAHPQDLAVDERTRRVLRKLERGEALALGSLSHGGGILDHAVHAGLADAGVPNWLAWACEREAAYLQASLERNPVWSAKTLLVHAEMEDVDPVLLPRVEVLVAGLPCTGASLAGRAKNRLSCAEEHESAGTPVLAFLAMIQRCQPVVVMLENVVAYQGTASMALIRASLARWGYSVHEHVVGADFGALEDRDRLCVVAVTRGFEFVWAPRPIRSAEACLGDVLEPIGPDDVAWRRCEYLDAKEERDRAAGKGFRTQLVTPASRSVGTIGRGYAKWRSTEPMLVHPSRSGWRRLLTPVEHAMVKTVPPALIEGLGATLAHELLGQSVLHCAWQAVAQLLGQHFQRWLEEAKHTAVSTAAVA